MLKTQQNCVETYLQDCILDTMDKVADDESRKEIEDMASKINDLAYDLEQTYIHLNNSIIYFFFFSTLNLCHPIIYFNNNNNNIEKQN